MSDTGRFEAFVREYQDMVFATAVRLVANVPEAEDIAQTVFLRAFERFEALADSPQAPGWLKTVTTNLCLNHLSRYRSRWRFFSELVRRDDRGDAPVAFETTLAAAEASPVAQFEAAEDRGRLEQALRALPVHQRVPLVLFHFEEKSYREIALLLGRSLAKVKTDMHRGREVLKAQLSAIGTTHGSR